MRAASAIRLNLTTNVLANAHEISTAKEFWEKLKVMYQVKSILNWLYLKEQLHTLRMVKGTKILDYLVILDDIIFELAVIGVKIKDEDKTFRLIWSLPPSCEHMKPIWMKGTSKETLDFPKVTSKLLFEERRLNSKGILHKGIQYS